MKYNFVCFNTQCWFACAASYSMKTRKELDDFSEIMRILSTQFAGPTFCATSNFEVQLKSLCNQLAESVSKVLSDLCIVCVLSTVLITCDFF